MKTYSIVKKKTPHGAVGYYTEHKKTTKEEIVISSIVLNEKIFYRKLLTPGVWKTRANRMIVHCHRTEKKRWLDETFQQVSDQVVHFPLSTHLAILRAHSTIHCNVQSYVRGYQCHKTVPRWDLCPSTTELGHAPRRNRCTHWGKRVWQIHAVTAY